MKSKIITDKERLDWLSRCSKIDNSGYDSGWAFERLIWTDTPSAVSDVKIAIRGREGVDDLRLAIDKAIAVDKLLGTSTNE